MVAATFPSEQNYREVKMTKSFKKAKLDVVSVFTLIFVCIETWQFKALSLYHWVCVIDRQSIF